MEVTKTVDTDGSELQVTGAMPVEIGVLCIVIAFIACVAACYFAYTANPMGIRLAEANAVNQKAVNEYNQATQKRIIDLQIKVVERCVSLGMAPMLNNNNVYCQKIEAK